MVVQLRSLLKLLPHTLSHHSLLIHCTWQAACMWKDDPEMVSIGWLLQTSCNISTRNAYNHEANSLWIHIHQEDCMNNQRTTSP